MKLKHLEEILEQVDDFIDPKSRLEQYKTRPHLAACMLFAAATEYDDITDKVVADIGAGTGCLSIGCAFLESQKVYSIETDPDAIEIFKKNIEEFDIEDGVIEIKEQKISSDTSISDLLPPPLTKVDTVVMNPPFGTKVPGIDVLFLKAALFISDTVYSIHKSSTREGLINKIKAMFPEKILNVKVIAEMNYDLKGDYRNSQFRNFGLDFHE